MTIEKILSINKYGQGLINSIELLEIFSSYDLSEKRAYLKYLIEMIVQSKPKEEDVNLAIKESNLKSTFTPCVLLKKGIARHHLQSIIELPEVELNKVFILLLNLFKIAYKRRFELEKNSPNKWWYWDLLDEDRVGTIKHNFQIK